MSDKTDRLEAEAERHRSNIDSTIDALKDRMSPGQMMDEALGFFKEGQVADAGRNFGQQVRDNPLALGLIGAGVAWLAFGSGVRSTGRDLYDRYGPDHSDHDVDEYGRFRAVGGRHLDPDRFPDSGEYHDPYRSPSDADPRTGGATYVSGSAGGSTGSSLKDKAASAGSSVSGAASSTGSAVGSAASKTGSAISSGASKTGSAISGAASSVGEGARSAGSAIGGAASSAASGIASGASATGQAASDAASSTGQAFADGGRAIGRGASQAGRSAARGYRSVQSELISAFRDEPLVFGAIAVAVGAAIGAALPPTRREDEWMGQTRDDLRDQAYQRGREAVADAQDVAEKTYAAASEKAEEKGLKPKGEGETFADKAADVARTAAKTAKDEAAKKT
ncbi:DUF3618 domain-containing protein [Notoacmeibacter sp. MSK16QG-6]|uniref:DUF3618 domain-containing protein n=1 Tax=Notoacmeibacter sp. MSK16QG-6 TaxID=2957982 RepID=UPI00209D684A|nr:DUF3618 domain-containing protein [Notoacmeibacter sp. MSK16QG-6]MCP1200166.1 DUF3618 domain-containing protein [Notoacmeibacter sp. MSK16QG-6]